MTTEELIREYYRCFNERRIADATKLFATDAVVEFAPFVDARGPDAYAQFADAWLKAFPDAELLIERIESRADTIREVDVRATGTHAGVLNLGRFGRLHPNGTYLTIRMRELLEIREGRIVFSSLGVDVQYLVRQLNRVNYAQLAEYLDTIRHLADELAAAPADTDQQRDITDRLGRALDKARIAVRPQFRQ
jgi:ketosteroid isomerase-like protein